MFSRAEEVKWNCRCFHSAPLPPGTTDKPGFSSHINGTEPLQRCEKTQVKIDPPIVPASTLQTRSNLKKKRRDKNKKAKRTEKQLLINRV